MFNKNNYLKIQMHGFNISSRLNNNACSLMLLCRKFINQNKALKQCMIKFDYVVLDKKKIHVEIDVKNNIVKLAPVQ